MIRILSVTALALAPTFAIAAAHDVPSPPENDYSLGDILGEPWADKAAICAVPGAAATAATPAVGGLVWAMCMVGVFDDITAPPQRQ